MTNDVTITITAEEASAIKRLLIKEERQLERHHEEAEAAELTALRQKIHAQI